MEDNEGEGAKEDGGEEIVMMAMVRSSDEVVGAMRRILRKWEEDGD